MAYLAAGFGLLLHILIWGSGLALLLAPRGYRRWWPFFAAPAGVALQSTVVWLGAYAGWPGTDAYGRWALLVPAALLAWALAPPSRRAFFLPGLKDARGAGLIMLLTLGVTLAPMTSASKALTSMSLGSCDAADYAAGARTLMEFARGDRTGFLGLTEVVRVKSVDNFYDFWLRLNHFTPSALLALNASIFGLKAHELTSVLAAVLLALTVPMVFWLARALLRLGPPASGFVAVVYGISPINLYGVYNVALGQLLAALAIALLTWAGAALWREGAGWRRGRAWAGLLAVAYVIILGGYNFIIVVCLVPAMFYAGGLAFWQDKWRRFGRWLPLMLAPLVFSGLLYAERMFGLVERFQLFREYDIGWRIPAMSPAGWWGLVAGPNLGSHGPWLEAVAGVLLLVALGGALLPAARRRQGTALLVFSLIVPVAAGYVFLELRGMMRGTSASYDAYKLLAVFYPGILAALCHWLVPLRHVRVWWRWSCAALAAGVLAGNAFAAGQFLLRMQNPPHIVNRMLAQLSDVERMPRVDSINMLVPDFWSRFWANAFLLRKPQYFRVHTYEGRRNTDLKGGWDLQSPLIRVVPRREEDHITVNSVYSLIDTRSPDFARVRFGDNWYDTETLPRVAMRWRWSRGNATLLIDNPQDRPLPVRCRLDLRSVVKRDLEIWLEDRLIWSGDMGVRRLTLRLPRFILKPGNNVLALRSKRPSASPTAHDRRALGFCLYGFEMRVLDGEGDDDRQSGPESAP